MKKLISGVLLSVFLLSGCASMGPNSPTVDLATKIATWKVIEKAENPEEKAVRVAAVADAALEYVSGEKVLVQVAVDAVKAQIDWDSMTRSDRLLAEELINYVAAEISARTDTGTLDGEALTSARRILTSVKTAALLY